MTGYGGSGVASVYYKKLGSEDEIPVTGNTFAVPENGSYILILTDQAGNQTRQSFTVSGIDTAPPEVQLSEVSSGWQPKAEITLTLSDKDSGIGSVGPASPATTPPIPPTASPNMPPRNR